MVRKVIRRPRRGRKMIRKRNYIRRGRISLVKRYKETYLKPQTLVTPGTTLGGRISCALNELGNVNGFNILYDLFKVTGMKIKLIPKINSNTNFSQDGVQLQNNLPMLYIAPNRNPLTPNPTSASDVLNDDQCRAIRFDKPVTLYLANPKPDQILYASADGSSVGRVVGQLNASSSKYQSWYPTAGNNSIQTQYTGMFWYGFRYWVDNGGSSTTLAFDTIVTEYVMFKEQD